MYKLCYHWKNKMTMNLLEGWVIHVNLDFYFIFKSVYFLKFYFRFYRERKGGERKGEKHWCEKETSVFGQGKRNTYPDKDRTRNPGTCPDWESNLRPSGLQAGAQSTEPHQPVLSLILNMQLSQWIRQWIQAKIAHQAIVCCGINVRISLLYQVICLFWSLFQWPVKCFAQS